MNFKRFAWESLDRQNLEYSKVRHELWKAYSSVGSGKSFDILMLMHEYKRMPNVTLNLYMKHFGISKSKVSFTDVPLRSFQYEHLFDELCKIERTVITNEIDYDDLTLLFSVEDAINELNMLMALDFSGDSDGAIFYITDYCALLIFEVVRECKKYNYPTANILHIVAKECKDELPPLHYQLFKDFNAKETE